jgi:hypothetical protein
MDARTLDVTTGIITLVVFIVMLIFLPVLFEDFKIPGGVGMAYVIAIVIYIVFMSGSGSLIREKIA